MKKLVVLIVETLMWGSWTIQGRFFIAFPVGSIYQILRVLRKFKMADIPAGLSSLVSSSEIAVGLVLNGKQSSTGFAPDKLSGKYAEMMKDLKAGKTAEELLVKYGSTLVQACNHAANSVNGLGEELDWVGIIDKAYRIEQVRGEVSRIERHLQNGEIEKASDLMARSIITLQTTQRLNSVLASEISDEYDPYILSGSPAWDEHVGGLPTTGLVVLGAKTATGKTTLAISLMEKFLQEYPSKKILFVTLEEMNEGWKHRAKVILGKREKAFWERIRVMEFADNTASIITEAARFPDVGMIIVDYLEYLVKESDVSTYTEVYKTLSMGSKSLAVSNQFRSMPIILVAQFGKTLYHGGVPTPDALPYVDERYDYMRVMLYQPDSDYYSDNPDNPYTLPVVKGKGYIIFWKCKNSKPHDSEFPGAIQVNHSSKYGYDLSAPGKWFSLASETKRAVAPKRK